MPSDWMMNFFYGVCIAVSLGLIAYILLLEHGPR